MRTKLRLSVLLVAALASGSALAARPCAAIDADARAAQASGKLEELIEYYKEAHDPDAGCDAQYLAEFGSDVALAHIDRFFALYDADKDLAAHKQILEDARSFGEPWQLLVTLAGVEADLGNNELAASFYQQAVADLQHATRDADASSASAMNLPSADEFKELYGKMAEATLLAQTFSPPAKSRGEAASGLFAESYRGYVVKAVPVPVQFQFASTRFTSKGEQVAQYLLDYLTDSKLTRIKLVGHTDPVGSDSANMALSMRRAEAVRDYLVDGGYSGVIEVEGRGETEPFEVVDKARFADEPDAINQLDRRVELVRNPEN